MMPVAVPAHGIGVGVSREQYTAHLREKKPVEPPDMRPFDPYGPWSPSVEDLTKATDAVQNLELQLEKLESMDFNGPMGEFLGPLVDGMYGPMLQQQLTGAREHRDRIQKRMEEQATAKEDQPECQ